MAIHCGVDHRLERSDLGMELARHRQYLPREVSRWRERESLDTHGVMGASGLFIGRH